MPYNRSLFFQFSSVAQSCQTLCDLMNHSKPGLTVYHQLPEFTQTHVHWVNDAIQPFHPLLSPSPPAFNLSQHQGLFKWVSSSHQVAKKLEFQIQQQSYQWTLRTDLLKMDWLDLLAVQGLSRVFYNTTVQKHQFLVLSFLYSPTLTSIHDYWKNHSFPRWTFVGKIMSLLFNMLSSLVITFLPRSKSLLISWLQSPSAVILEPPKNKVWYCFPIYFPWSDGARCHDLRFLNVEL